MYIKAVWEQFIQRLLTRLCDIIAKEIVKQQILLDKTEI